MNGEGRTPPDDTEHDAWLRAALRHAPDAATAAPPALGEAILREASVKAHGAGAARRPTDTVWWSQAWAWLARPSVGAAFAGVVVATTVGLLWHDTPPPEPPRPEAQVAAAPPASPAPQDTAAAPAPQPAPEPRRESSREPTAQAPAAKRAAPPVAKREAVPAAPTPAPLAKRRAPVSDGAAQEAAGGSESMSMAAAPPPPVASADAGRAPAAVAAAPALHPEQRLAAAATTFSLAQVRAAVTAEPAAWTWQRAGAAAQPMGDALAEWLAALDAAAGPRWQRAAARSETASSADDVLLLHGGRAAHRLHLDADRLRWDIIGANGAIQRWQVPLGPDEVRALQAQLDAATR